MSFLNIKDVKERDATIAEYLALKKRLKQRFLAERSNFIEHQQDLEEQYEPVVASNKKMKDDIVEQLIPITEELHKLTGNLLARPKLTAKRRIAMKRDFKDDNGDGESQPPRKRDPELNDFGPHAQDFISKYMDNDLRRKGIDTTFGLRFEKWCMVYW